MQFKTLNDFIIKSIDIEQNKAILLKYLESYLIK